MTVLFAQSTQGADRLFADILPWLGILVVIILLGGGLALFLRRRFATIREGVTPGFTLADLRRMRDSGEISEEEFTTAKSRMLQSMKPMERPAPDASAIRKGSTGRVPRIPPARRDEGPTTGDDAG
ncbi:MAG: hypothetical protein CMJ22_12545 [Phycisphaerae bacterium]|nr:hypothetical protein [Phycisphaerae bacterium]MCP3860008.1 SHOCT domain-containing protein [Phycisphaeraceae bacterium]MDG1359984.1 SHOCT domain-containing protein [Phycisphaerales bacterium]MCP4495675.1 SHOCT domain-containing protein [Phycisphaeraceae bacterium]MCP4796237.1 SHOCT domain-containing protein [Phycisphaeraceae bacterium]